jgi:hypothetical protein
VEFAPDPPFWSASFALGGAWLRAPNKVIWRETASGGVSRRGAAFDSIRVASSGPRRRPRSWNRELTRGYNGRNEDLVTKVVAVLNEATGRGWSPPARLPDVPAMAVLLDVRRRPAAEAIVSRDRITVAVTRLFEARQEWGSLPLGGSLSRAWQATGLVALRLASGADRRAGPLRRGAWLDRDLRPGRSPRAHR